MPSWPLRAGCLVLAGCCHLSGSAGVGHYGSMHHLALCWAVSTVHSSHTVPCPRLDPPSPWAVGQRTAEMLSEAVRHQMLMFRFAWRRTAGVQPLDRPYTAPRVDLGWPSTPKKGLTELTTWIECGLEVRTGIGPGEAPMQQTEQLKIGSSAGICKISARTPPQLGLQGCPVRRPLSTLPGRTH